MTNQNYENIRAIFENRTGVTLPRRRGVSPAVVTAGIVAAAAACVTVTALAVGGAAVKGQKASV